VLAPNLVGGQPHIGFLQDLHYLAFRKSRPLHANLPAKSCQKVLIPACLASGEAYEATLMPLRPKLRLVLRTLDAWSRKYIAGTANPGTDQIVDFYNTRRYQSLGNLNSANLYFVADPLFSDDAG
jgi:hypothetical protein